MKRKRWMTSWRSSQDVPFMGHFSEKWIPWVMGLMIFLSTLCVMMFIESWWVARDWQHDLKGRWTIELTPQKDKLGFPPSALDGEHSEAESRVVDAFKKQALKTIMNDSSVTEAHVLERPQLIKTLEPWLGTGNLLDDLPLPLFVDVSSNRSQSLDVEHLRQELMKISDTVTIQDHEIWYRPLVQFMRLVQGLSVGLGIVIFGASAAIMMIVMSMNLSVHKNVIHTLQLIGASDAYIVKQCQRHMHKIAFKAWIIGIVPSIESLLLFQWAVHSLQKDASFNPMSSSFLWVVILVVPLVFWLLLTLTTRLTVLRELRHEFT